MSDGTHLLEGFNMRYCFENACGFHDFWILELEIYSGSSHQKG